VKDQSLTKTRVESLPDGSFEVVDGRSPRLFFKSRPLAMLVGSIIDKRERDALEEFAEHLEQAAESCRSAFGDTPPPPRPERSAGLSQMVGGA
jgi:hypothetical protein